MKQPDQCAHYSNRQSTKGDPNSQETDEKMFNFSANQRNAYAKRGLLSTPQIVKD